jgi:hypothetical protein
VKIISALQDEQVRGKLGKISTPYAPLRGLSDVFSRLDTQASQMVHGRPAHLILENVSMKEYPNGPEVPSSFDDLESARNHLAHIRTLARATQQMLPNATTTAPDTFPRLPVKSPEVRLSLELIRSSALVRLRLWSHAFDMFLQEKECWSTLELRGVTILKLHRCLMELSFGMDLVHAMEDETAWDERHHYFEKLVTLSQEVIESSAGVKGQPTFTLETEVILPLYYVAAKCRDGILRRKAITLLRREQRQEGIGNSLLAARVAERTMEIEEANVMGDSVKAEQISRWDRIRGTEIGHDSGRRKARLKFVKLRPDWEFDQIFEVISW